MSQIVNIDPKEYGLEESKAEQIANQFKPMLDKMVELEKEFNEIVVLPIESPTTSARAKELRLKYVKVRTGTAEIHKAQKAFYLAGGRFIDGWKNAQLFASQGIEEKLDAIEKYAENLEKERKLKLKAEREAELSNYCDNVQMFPLGDMEQLAYEQLLNGQILAHEAKIESERKAEEQRIAIEKAEALKDERKVILLELGAKINDGKVELVCEDFPDATNVLPVSALGDFDEKTWSNYLEEYKSTASENAKHRERIRLENIELKKKQEEQDKLLAEERAKAEAKEKAAEAEAKRIADETAKREAEVKAKADADQKRMQEEAQKKIAEERKERERVEAELKAKQEEEARIKAEEAEREQAELAKGDADKISDLQAELEALKTKFHFRSAKNKKTYAEVGTLLDKIINHIISKQ